MSASNLVALAHLMGPRDGEPPLGRFELSAPAADGSTWRATLERSALEVRGCGEADSLEAAVGLALHEVHLGTGVRGSLPRPFEQLVQWLGRGPARHLEVVLDERRDVASSWRDNADESDDIWLTCVRLHAPSGALEAYAPTFVDACAAALAGPAWRRLQR